jgi:hypothetical protein
MKTTLLVFVLLSLNALAKNSTDGLPEVVKNYFLTTAAKSCDLDHDFHEGSKKYVINGKTDLYIVPCWEGAYQTSSVLYIVTNDTNVTALNVLSYALDSNSVFPSTDVTNVEFDPSTRLLTTFSKARGLGDCGQSSVSKIMVESYFTFAKTIEIRNKSNCDTKMDNWPVVFKQ